MVVSVDVDGGDLVKSINGEVALHQELVIVECHQWKSWHMGMQLLVIAKAATN
jgi:hypothetical protein